MNKRKEIEEIERREKNKRRSRGNYAWKERDK
jgi:hypothetical protein